MDELLSVLRKRGIVCASDVPGSALTTFGSGGQVGAVIYPRSAEEIRFVRRICADLVVENRVMGGGSNLLLPDEGYHGALLRFSAFSDLKREGNELIAGAGVKLPALSRRAAAEGLSGLEFACGIPGETGGAICSNAGAFKQMISDTLVEVTLLTKQGELRILKAQEIEFCYHRANLPLGAAVLSARFRLTHSERGKIEETMRFMTERRRATQPCERSAGSVFRRAGETPAAVYIERTGLKGERLGGAELSAVHCNFIVNKGGATTSDYFALAERVREKVRSLCGVSLEYEVERCSRSES